MTEKEIERAVAAALVNHGIEHTLRAVARGLMKRADDFDPQDRIAVDLEETANEIDRIACRQRFVD